MRLNRRTLRLDRKQTKMPQDDVIIGDDETVMVTLRMPISLKNWLRDVADSEDRTLTAQVLRILRLARQASDDSPDNSDSRVG